MKKKRIQKVNKIGTGGFSEVFEIKLYDSDSQYKLYAMKNAEPTQDYGLESIFENYVMKNIKHQSLNSSVELITTSDGSVSIIQPLAIGDASTLIKKSLTPINDDTLRLWLFQTCCGLLYLHNHNIASNILIFEDPVTKEWGTKLNDFGLSRLILDQLEGTKDYENTSYTSTHRPIEVWTKLEYSLPSDIWALGCTFYELKYKRLLFPQQTNKSKAIEIEAHINNFIHWDYCESDNVKSDLVEQAELLTVSKISVPQLPIGHKSQPISIPKPLKVVECRSNSVPVSSSVNKPKFKLSPDWSNPNNKLLNDLIMAMLNINPLKRLTIEQVIEHEYFDKVRLTHKELIDSTIEIPKLLPLSKIERELITSCNKYTKDPTIIELAAHLLTFGKCNIKTAITVAGKILHRTNPIKKVDLNSVKDELSFCNQIDYNFFKP